MQHRPGHIKISDSFGMAREVTHKFNVPRPCIAKNGEEERRFKSVTQLRLFLKTSCNTLNRAIDNEEEIKGWMVYYGD